MPIPTTLQPNSRLGSIKNLLAGPHGPGSRIFEELAKFSVDYTYWKEDFLGLLASDGFGAGKAFQYVETGGGEPVDPTKLAPTAAKTSYITWDGGAADPSSSALVTQLQFCAKWNPFWESRFQENTTYATGTVEFFFGFVAALPATAGPILGEIDTPTFAMNVTDAAGIGFDTDSVLKTGAHITIGAHATVGKTIIDTGFGAPYTQPTLNVDVTYRVELRSATPNDSVSTSYVFIDNNLVDTGRVGPDAEVPMAAVFWHGNRGARVIYQVDYLAFGQEKNGGPF